MGFYRVWTSRTLIRRYDQQLQCQIVAFTVFMLKATPAAGVCDCVLGLILQVRGYQIGITVRASKRCCLLAFLVVHVMFLVSFLRVPKVR